MPPHPRARIWPAGKSPCEVGRELRDQAQMTGMIVPIPIWPGDHRSGITPGNHFSRRTECPGGHRGGPGPGRESRLSLPPRSVRLSLRVRRAGGRVPSDGPGLHARPPTQRSGLTRSRGCGPLRSPGLRFRENMRPSAFTDMFQRHIKAGGRYAPGSRGRQANEQASAEPHFSTTARGP